MGDLYRDSGGAGDGWDHPRRIVRDQHRGADWGFTSFPIADVELRRERRRANLSPYPTDVNFALVSDPLSGAAGFAASVESADGTVSLALGDLAFGLGNLQSSGYTGAVSVLQGHLQLSSLLDSAALFSAPSIDIVLQNEGPDVTVGLAPYLMRHDLFASLSGGPLSVGAITGSVELEIPDKPLNLKRSGGPVIFALDSEVPEPQTLGLLFGGGALLCGLSAVLARVSRRRKQGYRAKNQPFASANPL